MNKKSFLKSLSYNPFIIKTIRFFHLRSILRKCYYYWACPKNNILQLQIDKIDAKFYVPTPDELRLAESVSGALGEQRILKNLISNLNLGDVVYDIGANIGIYTVILAKAVGNNGKVVAFEPEKESADRLQDNVKINNLNNVQIVRKALGDNNSQGKLYIGKTTGNFSLVKTYEEGINYQTVEIIKGDEFVKAQNLPIPKLVKIDIEGYEYSALSGLRETLIHPDCKIICCEVHPGLFPEGITEDKVLELIKSFGFLKMDTFKRPFSAYHVIAYKN